MKKDFNDHFPKNAMVPSVRDKDGTGYDIFSLLLKDRVIMVTGQVEPGMTSVIIAQIKYLEHIDSTKEITMLINSPGGSVVDGLAIYDIMRETKCPIRTVGNGMQASMGSILLAGGDERHMYKNSMVLVHQIMGGAQNGTQHTDFEISGAFMAQQHEALKSVYVEHTGLNHKFWDLVGERDTWLTTEQAVKIGYVHRAIINEKADGPYAAEATRSEKVGLHAALDKTTKDFIAQMSAEDVKKALNSGNAEGGIYARLRGDLVVKLSEFPEFWTEGKKAKMAAEAAASATANDNGAGKPAAKKASNGPNR